MQTKETWVLALYRTCMSWSEGFLSYTLQQREKAGKESLERLDERKGKPSQERPKGGLIWLHAASVGEAQSALILIKSLLNLYPEIHILVTTGTLSSAKMMSKNLPERAFHQFYPVDQPEWVASFLDHWKPDFILWMESELWPNMLQAIKERDIPAVMVNARLSPKSYKRWSFFKNAAQTLLGTFSLILCQTLQDEGFFKKLGGQNVHTTDNLKYSAAPLPCNEDDLIKLNAALASRPVWVYASTHASEETIAAQVHERLKTALPDLLTIVVPRHPERRGDIQKDLKQFHLNVEFRSEEKALPSNECDIYIADTMGELGLFYRASDVACIGRSFSDDGGGGHNPIEAAQLHCAVLHGPNIQNLQDIFDEMNIEGAAYCVKTPEALGSEIETLLSDPALLEEKKQTAFKFAEQKEQVLDTVMLHIRPLINQTFEHAEAM